MTSSNQGDRRAVPPIRFATATCSLGAILVAASGRGVCAILLGDDREQLVGDLQARFPDAASVAADGELGPLISSIAGFVDVPAAGLDIPLDIGSGTEFQQKVWTALREIPAGSTASYAAVASRIGAPAAVRAVARACAANPLAVVVPCHRVIRTDGALSGYRWGVDRKRALLDRERCA